jgi:hypothetical protein
MTDVVKLQVLEVGLELTHLSTVSVHRVLLDVVGLADLIDDNLRVTVGDKPLDS